jgi:hypothetical protein
MGAGLGASYGSTKSSSTATGTSTGTSSNTYSAPQKSLQDELGSSLSSSLDASNKGTLSPGVKAEKNAAADQINKTSGGLLDRVNSFLAARGFGKSGATGKAALSSELGRESDLGANEANFAQVQQTQNSSNLMAALQYAFQQLGLTQDTSETGTTSGKSSGFQVGGGVSAGFTGIPGIKPL